MAQREHINGQMVFSAGSAPASAINKIKRSQAILMAHIPASINSFLLPEASVNNADWSKCLDQSGTLVYLDCSGFTADFWWTIEADVMPAHYLRLVSCTDANGTAGSAISGTVEWMGFS